MGAQTFSREACTHLNVQHHKGLLFACASVSRAISGADTLPPKKRPIGREGLWLYNFESSGGSGVEGEKL